MAAPRKLKVFCTPIGFHDAYVAAPSRKAALAAWGSDRDLFARGIAEEVTDAALTNEPLANPGKVIRRLRATAAEQIAAVAARPAPAKRATPEAKPRSTPRPSRRELEAAQAALATAEQRQREEREALDRRRAELEREQAVLEAKHATERETLVQVCERAQLAYQRAVDRWSG